MGKSKKEPRGEEADAEASLGAPTGVPVDLKSVVAMRVDHRAKWLAKACKAVAQGNVKAGQLYDVLSNRKVVQGVPAKVGQRMLRTMQGHIALFSERQQRHLLTDSPLATSFRLPDVDSDADQTGEQAARDKGTASKVARAEDEAAKMEEMMARCRNFVRENANQFAEREQEVERRVREAEEAVIRAQKAAIQAEWDAIQAWHEPFRAWEASSMLAQDEPGQKLEAERAALAKEVEEVAREQRERTMRKRARGSPSSSSDENGTKKRPAEESKKRLAEELKKRLAEESKKRRSSSRSRRSRSRRSRKASAKRRSRDRDRDRDRDREREKERERDRDRDRERDRDRDRRRRRRSSSS
eukprot:TRINITY_DN8438_c0_g1_i1.p1 TRINITY_DN8438_c0_g1~~TRINITY_DN8438_c0_g1_i1.p1  ORF type:complete len:356 (+),score=88.44 TRINITY_DN8438_c0_g1_i1:77-1144(+)